MTNKPRRQHTLRRPRIKVSWPVTVKVDNRLLHGEALDVSAFGVKVRLEERLHDTSIVTLHLEPTRGHPLDLQAILWRTDNDGPVFFFLKQVPEFLAQISGTTPASGTPSPPPRVSSILVVDDAPDIGSFAQGALASEGYLVRVTADPPEPRRMTKRG